MHEAVFYGAAIWMTGLLVVMVFTVIRARSDMVRLLALDSLSLVLIAFLILYADTFNAPFYLDAAVVLALLSFIATLAAARYHTKGRVFD